MEFKVSMPLSDSTMRLAALDGFTLRCQRQLRDRQLCSAEVRPANVSSGTTMPVGSAPDLSLTTRPYPRHLKYPISVRNGHTGAQPPKVR